MSHLHYHRAAVLVGMLALAACGEKAPEPKAMVEPAREASTPASTAGPSLLVAQMAGIGDNKVTGVVVLSGSKGRIVLGAALDQVAAGQHAIHVHETGDCSGSGGNSAGGHFSPNARSHGGPAADVTERHAGDFGNFTASAFEQGKFSVAKSSDVALDAFEGRAIIVHAGADDFSSQPAGAAGARIACGVLKVSND